MGENKDLNPDEFFVSAVQQGTAQYPAAKPGEPLEPKSEPKPDPKEELARALGQGKESHESTRAKPVGRAEPEEKPRVPFVRPGQPRDKK